MSKEELKKLVCEIIDDMNGSDTFKLGVKRPEVYDEVSEGEFLKTKPAPYKEMTLVITRHDRTHGFKPNPVDDIEEMSEGHGREHKRYPIFNSTRDDVVDAGKLAEEIAQDLMTSCCCNCGDFNECSRTYEGAEPDECDLFKERDGSNKEAGEA